MPDTLTRLTTALSDRYRLERELGRGGMATVYLAEDLKHRRRVAIKVLKPELAAVLGAERFVREITTTANLRHPHILPLYDSGEAGEFLFYVMPFVDGESLRDRLDRERQLPLDDAIRIAREVADALNYAHAHGVIHRDIKPENILLESGHAVVGDFGIAKALDVAGGDVLTGTGIALGTPRYMSPEQAAGERDLDRRSDLYSLGCVLYEMLGGQPPFQGPTVESVVRQHLTVEAPPITNLRTAVPASIGAALHRALAKAPADRFDTVSGFAAALADPAVSRDAADRQSAVGRGGRRVSRRLIIGLCAALALLVVAASLVWRRNPKLIQLGRQVQATHEQGLEIDPALSADGRYLAYSGAKGVLMVRPVDGGDAIRVIRNGDGKGRWPAWQPDGQRLVFLSPRGLESVPALGGTPRLVSRQAAPELGLALAPDGRTVAFISHDSLLAEPVDGGSARLILAGREIHSPAWSPDGRWIALVSGNVQYVSLLDRSLGNIAPCSIEVVPAGGGTPTRVSNDQSMNVSPAWTRAGALLYVSDRDGSRDIYQVTLSRSGAPTGVPVRVTTGLNALGITISGDGSRLAYSRFTESSNVWSLAIPEHGAVSVSEAQPVTTEHQTIENLGVSHDSQWLAFSSVLGATSQVYRLRLNHPGAEQEQLTTDTVGSFWASWSPDDREIAFHRFYGERREVFVMSADGSGQMRVTDGSEDERSPEWSPDGTRLLLLANWGTHPALEIVSRGADGRWSSPLPLPVVIGRDTLAAGLGVWSPDGRSVACGCGAGGLAIVSVASGQAHRLPSPFSTAGWAFPQWSADGRSLYYLMSDSAGVAAVIAAPLSGDLPHVAVRFDDPTRPWHRFGFRVRNGRMYFTLGDLESQIWAATVAAGREPGR